MILVIHVSTIALSCRRSSLFRDTAGQERFNSLGRIFYRGADCCLLSSVPINLFPSLIRSVFDVTRSKTLQDLTFWRQEFIKNAEIDGDDFTFILVGNRADLESEREVSQSMAQEWARSTGCILYIETSAKTGANVEGAFRGAVQDVLRRANFARHPEQPRSASIFSSFLIPRRGQTLSAEQLDSTQRQEEPCC